MNHVNFFGNKVSKLIVGDNPITGHSYIIRVLQKFKYAVGQMLVEKSRKKKDKLRANVELYEKR